MTTSSEQQPYTIYPYLNPAYWDGHTLGLGEINDEGMHSDASYADTKLVHRAFAEQHFTDRVTPLATLRTGESFDPALYRPGTLLLMRGELLAGRPLHFQEIGAAEEKPVPSRPIETYPSFGAMSAHRYLRDKQYNRSYFAPTFWGVVPEDNTQQQLICIDARKIRQSQNGAQPSDGFYRMGIARPIGETGHVQASKTAKHEEYLNRVNVLHVVQHGVAERGKRRRIFATGHWALRKAIQTT